ncbi:MAG: transglycosylase SLT domain-containing protein [Halioglobus sp.]
MRYHSRRNSRKGYLPEFVSLLAATLLCSVSIAVCAQDLGTQRRDYAAAEQAIQHDQWARYQNLRSTLDDYPLAIYLDYAKLVRQVDEVTPAAAQDFLGRSADSPLRNRFLTVYLNRLGKDQRWQEFLKAMPTEPNSAGLKCFYFRAQLAQGNEDSAWQGAARLWVQGKSQPDECDALFNAWQAAGGITDELVWRRLLNAFDARQQSLLQFVAGKSSAQLRPWADKLLAVYAKPGALATQNLPVNSPYSTDIASRGLAYLATYSPETALLQWRELQRRLQFSSPQTQQVEYAIALQSLFARTEAHRDWLHDTLARLQDDKLTGIRLRWALREQDWDTLERTLPLLSASARQDNVWRYWEADVKARRGDATAATAQFKQLAGERDYYGFLAADRLGLPYSFNHQKLVPSGSLTVAEIPAVLRIEELKFQGEEMLAHAEWYKLLQDTTDRTQQQDLTVLASQKGWYRMAIDAATRAEAWDALDQRFPTPYNTIFVQYAKAQKVPDTELMAIARRESAFFPGAQSPVGARGLMQIMPATGKAVAASLGQAHKSADLFDVEHNVLLGSAYYRQLLDRFDGNRVYALTAYNAGPNRVDRWRNKPGQGVPEEVWIETIPYQETRNYVQAVLSYNVVFQYLLGESPSLLTAEEKNSSY